MNTQLFVPGMLWDRYQADPVGTDAELRRQLRLPDDKYYTVSVWPVPGRVLVDDKRHRAVKAVKVSKSDQQ